MLILDGNMRTGKRVISAKGETNRRAQDFNAISSFSLTYLEIQRYFQKEPRHNDRAYVINRHKYKSIGTHWIA